MRTPLPLHAEDISAFARSLGGQLAGLEQKPSHLQLLNMLARSAGYRNFQHLRAQGPPRTDLAQQTLPPSPTPSVPVAEPLNENRLKRLARLFDAEGRLSRWPSRRGLEAPCLWVVWSRVPARRVFTEAELNEVLAGVHSFGDHPLLRRGMVDLGLMTRTPDGREYRRVEAQPTAEALALFEVLRGRAG